MFNLLPGAGLAFTGSKLIAFGLAPVGPVIQPEVIPEIRKKAYGGGGGFPLNLNILDNQYSVRHDEEESEIVEICTILCMGLEWDQ